MKLIQIAKVRTEKMESSENTDGSTPELASLVQDADFCRSLVENGSDAIVSTNTDSTVLYANQAVERVFSYEPEARR